MIKKCLYLLVVLVALTACNNEDPANPQFAGLQVNADFLKLSDNKTPIAGNLVISTDAPEVTLRWNTGNLCNLDTTQTTLKVSDGRAVLPVRWMKMLEDGTYGPQGIGFKAGVQITSGDYIQYVPLVWADKVDSTEIARESVVRTRAAGDIMPRVSQISMIPSTINLNDQNGGTMYISLTDVAFVILDASEFNTSMNLDMANIPSYIMASQMLDFKWNANGAPDFDFSARLVAMSEGLTVEGIVNYLVGGTGGGTLNYVNSNLPTGNIPRTGGTYTFTFEGTYRKTLQVRALADGVVINTGAAIVTKQPSVTVTENTNFAFRNITFQYKRDNADWVALPQTTNRTQGHPGEGIALGGYTWAPGNLVRIGGVYQFYTNQWQSSGVWSGGDYWNWNTLDPTNYSISVTGYGNPANDPCKQVAPAGTWRTPSSTELQVLQNQRNYWGNLNGVPGRYFGPNGEIFLRATGWRYKTTSVTNFNAGALYWSSTPNGTGGSAYCLGIQSTAVNLDSRGHRAIGSAVRCVRN